MTAVTTS